MADAAIVEIAEYHSDIVSSLRLYFGQMLLASASDFRDRDAIATRLTARLEETDQRSAFFILTSLEAAFRVDYQFRCEKRMKDDLSRAFRAIWKSRKMRVRLDEDIFEAWREYSSGSRQLIAGLRSAFNFRHCLPTAIIGYQNSVERTILLLSILSLTKCWTPFHFRSSD